MVKESVRILTDNEELHQGAGGTTHIVRGDLTHIHGLHGHHEAHTEALDEAGGVEQPHLARDHVDQEGEHKEHAAREERPLAANAIGQRAGNEGCHQGAHGDQGGDPGILVGCDGSTQWRVRGIGVL